MGKQKGFETKNNRDPPLTRFRAPSVDGAAAVAVASWLPAISCDEMTSIDSAVDIVIFAALGGSGSA